MDILPFEILHIFALPEHLQGPLADDKACRSDYKEQKASVDFTGTVRIISIINVINCNSICL